jgi:transcriptional regulator of heat shock response
MPRSADHDARRKDILAAAIELYLDSAQPVSSEILRKKRKVRLSSASVRHVFSELEEFGYLTHPHTSAGRVPTDGGYRYYINTLMKKKRLTKEEASFIDKICELKIEELGDLLSEVPRIMSDFTHYASIISFGDNDEDIHFQGIRYILEHPEFSDVRRAHMVLEAIEEKEILIDLIKQNFLDKTVVYIGKETKCHQMESCSVIVSHCYGSGAKEGRLALIGPKRMAYDKVIPLIEYIAEVVSRKMERF